MCMAMWLGNGEHFLFLVSEGEEKGHFPPRLATKTSFVVLSSPLSLLSPRTTETRRADPWEDSQNYARSINSRASFRLSYEIHDRRICIHFKDHA